MIALLLQAKTVADARYAKAVAAGEQGQGMVEYGLILAAIGAAGVFLIGTLGPAILGQLTDANTQLF